MTTPRIEPIEANDTAAVARVHAACFNDAWNAATLEKILAMPGAFGVVARLAPRGPAVGFAIARIAVDECELLSIGVDPANRHCGVGRGLFEATLAHAATAAARSLFLEVAEDNDIALQLYAGYGMVAVGRRPNYYETNCGGRKAAITLKLDLSQRSF